jgi:hypothetical protein
LLPTLAHHVLRADAPRPTPAATTQVLREALQRTAVYNTKLLVELARVSALLRAAAIEHVALKGAALLLRHYPTLAARHTVDLDLLVDPARFTAAEAALRAHGFVDDPHYTHTLVGDGTSLAEAWPSRAHACPPLRSPSGVNVDLHHRVPVSTFAADGGFAAWRARAIAHELHGVRVPLCSDDDLALHLCEHFVLQHHADPDDAPRLLCDLRALYARASPPWHSLRAGSLRRLASVELTRQLYDATFTPSAHHPLTPWLQRVATGDARATLALAELSHLRSHTERLTFNVLHRPGYALRTVFPTREYMARRYGVEPASPRLYPLYVTRLLGLPFAPLRRRR